MLWHHVNFAHSKEATVGYTVLKASQHKEHDWHDDVEWVLTFTEAVVGNVHHGTATHSQDKGREHGVIELGFNHVVNSAEINAG